MDKKCSSCSVIKDITEFGLRHKNKEYRQAFCKGCAAERSILYYKQHKKKILGKALKAQEEDRIWLRELKDNKPCMDCKVVHRHFALDYDHRDPSKKLAAVGNVLNRNGREAALKEMSKCDLICANCHRYRTYAVKA
jgi:hypothetical protein